VDQFDAGERVLYSIELLEPQHRTTPAADVPVILLNDVVEVYALADLDTRVVVIIVVPDRRGIHAALVDVDQAGLAVPINGFGQKTAVRPSYRAWL
jgi:hypothetical protein